MNTFHQLKQPFKPYILPFIMNQLMPENKRKIFRMLQDTDRKNNSRLQKARKHRRYSFRAAQQLRRPPNGQPAAGLFITDIYCRRINRKGSPADTLRKNTGGQDCPKKKKDRPDKPYKKQNCRHGTREMPGKKRENSISRPDSFRAACMNPLLLLYIIQLPGRVILQVGVFDPAVLHVGIIRHQSTLRTDVPGRHRFLPHRSQTARKTVKKPLLRRERQEHPKSHNNPDIIHPRPGKPPAQDRTEPPKQNHQNASGYRHGKKQYQKISHPSHPPRTAGANGYPPG